MTDEHASIQIGDFRIERQIGAGGMGIVYLARQVSLDRLVALKVLGQKLTRPSDKARFHREAQAVARLSHPNIASVHFIGQDDRLCYMAMEYIEGASLREVVERLANTTESKSTSDDFVISTPSEDGVELERFDVSIETSDFDFVANPVEEFKLTPEAEHSITTKKHIARCCEIVRDVANALAHAHQKGVIHRDLKPDNLMLDREGNVHIIDFGVARFFEDATLTQTGQLVGTPLYMSPEQVAGRIELDHRTDIYSLGLVLYELLCLRPPIKASTRERLLRIIVTKPLEPVSWHNNATPPNLESVVHKATAKDPDERYASAFEFAQDLDAILLNKPVMANSYRFSFDAREIVSNRPPYVVIVSFIFFFAGASSSIIALAFIMEWLGFGSLIGGRQMINTAVTQSVLAVVFTSTGFGLLSGRVLAWWVALICSLLVPMYCALNAFNYSTAQAAIILLTAVFAMLTMSYSLLKRETRDWIRFASRARADYNVRVKKIR